MPIKVFNTLVRKLEIFEPLQPDLVKIYVCGPTVQDVAHLGHARTYIAFDAIIRFLEYRKGILRQEHNRHQPLREKNRRGFPEIY
ncbi:MAG: hypothetical protein J7L83_02600, partial [Thaumarchaeota archaeon]|nr:hypothetical protein [Nitrososphaerota archaeon]